MKLGLQTHTDIVSGAQDEIAIAFEANAVAFYAQISGLAKDKIGYPIRELSTNAWDASRGRFDVHLPTPLNPVFRVRDYGPGMSAEQMKTVYARLYASTKRGNNDEVGGWGLGSKSPYAYLIGDNGSGSYNVTSYHGGMMRTYVLSLSSEGAPMMRLLAEIPSNEPTGLDVSFPVRREDIYTFQDRANSILWSFNPRPNVTPTLNWQAPVIKSSGENWTNYDPRTVPFSRPQVRMGCVMYPFDLSQVKTSGFLDIYDCILFDTPIGSLKVTLSREELAYDDKTKATLSSLVEQYENSFIAQLRDKVDAAETLFEANTVFEEAVSNLGQSRAERLREIVTWNDLPLTHYIVKYDFKTARLGEGWQQFDKFEDNNITSTWAKDATVVIEHNPCYSLSRFAMAGLVGKKILWVRCKRIHREETLRRLGNPEVIDLDSFKVPVEKRVSKTIRKRRTIQVSDDRIHRLTQNIDMADGGFYVQVSSGPYRRGRDFFKVSDNLDALSIYDLQGVIQTCVDFGILEVGTVILVKDIDQDIGDNWTPLGDEIEQGLRDKVDISQFTGLHQKTIASLSHQLRKMSDLPSSFAAAPEDLKLFHHDLVALRDSLQRQNTTPTDSDKAYAALTKLGASIRKPDVSCPIDEIEIRWGAITKIYPLLDGILESGGYYSWNTDNIRMKLAHYFELLNRPKPTDETVGLIDDLDEAA